MTVLSDGARRCWGGGGGGNCDNFSGVRTQFKATPWQNAIYVVFYLISTYGLIFLLLQKLSRTTVIPGRWISVQAYLAGLISRKVLNRIVLN